MNLWTCCDDSGQNDLKSQHHQIKTALNSETEIWSNNTFYMKWYCANKDGSPNCSMEPVSTRLLMDSMMMMMMMSRCCTGITWTELTDSDVTVFWLQTSEPQLVLIHIKHLRSSFNVLVRFVSQRHDWIPSHVETSSLQLPSSILLTAAVYLMLLSLEVKESDHEPQRPRLKPRRRPPSFTSCLLSRVAAWVWTDDSVCTDDSSAVSQLITTTVSVHLLLFVWYS